MKVRKICSILLSMSLLVSVASCSKTNDTTDDSGDVLESIVPVSDIEPLNTQEEDDDVKTAALVSCELPEGSWQIDATFPDWQDRSSTAANNRLCFYSYIGQGSLYLEISSDCEKKFNLYINEKLVDTKAAVPGQNYLLDISSYTVNGLNTLQLSSVDTGTVKVKIPYPTVIDGTLEDVGLSKDAFDLIDRIISADIENGFTAAQLAVVKDGRLVYENSWGNVRTYDESGSPVDADPVTNETLFDLASNTKMYSVNYALQYLMTTGEITPDTKIADILGSKFYEDTIEIDYEGYDDISLEQNKEYKSKLTVGDLMEHRGGFPAGPQYFNDRYDQAAQYYDSDNGNILYVGTGADEASRELMREYINKTPLLYKPGTTTMYSDLDYMTLCFCVEAITGRRLDEFLDETFYGPMGLDHITYNPLDNGFGKDDCAATELMGNTRDGNVRYTGIRDYTLRGEVHDPNAYYCMAGVSGHAGLFSNAGDLAKLASVMLTGGYGNNRFFSRDVMDLCTGPMHLDSSDFALGWWREADHARDYHFGSAISSDVYGHQGFTGTLTVIDPENNMVIVLLTNKVHSKILPGDATLNTYCGGFYTTGQLGFISEIIHMGLQDPDPAIWNDLVEGMIEDQKKAIDSRGITDPEHPRMCALKALESVIE